MCADWTDSRVRPSRLVLVLELVVSAPVEMTRDVQRCGTEMCSLVRLSPAVVSSASRRLQTLLPSERSLGKSKSIICLVSAAE